MLVLLWHTLLDVEWQTEFAATSVEEAVEWVEEAQKVQLEGLYESLVSDGSMLLWYKEIYYSSIIEVILRS